MKSLYKLTALLLLLQLRSFGQLNTFGPVAENMQTSSINTYGIPTSNYWWCAHGVDVLVDGYLRTRQDVYKTRMKNLLLGIRSFNGNTYINHFYDDMEWLGIASLRSYQITGDADYLNVANQLWTDMKNGYTNGAIDWNKSCTGCKNTCSNTPAVIMGVKLYRTTGVAADLQRAKDIYSFVKNTLVDASTGAVWDNIQLSTGAISKAVYPYNVGTYIGAGWELFKVTGDVTYLNDAIKSAEYAMNSRTVNNILFSDFNGTGDGGLFKGIFVRYFSLLAREAGIPEATRARYNEAIRVSAESLRTHLSSNYLAGPNWTVTPTSTPDYATQLSGVMLIEAAATLDQSFFYKDINYGGAPWGLTAGSYNTAALVAKGIANNDVTSYTVPAGYQVTFYKNDNFTGESLTVTANNAWIGNAWNDSISSLIISQIGGTSSTLIQAENYSSMSGIITETTNDTNGGQNVGAIDTGDWMAYNSIYFPTTGTYKVEYRVSSLSGGGKLSLDLNAGSIVLGNLDIPSTNGWQNWITISHNVTVTAGTYNLGVFAQTGGWNINWIRITKVAGAALAYSNTPAKAVVSVNMYPNPVSNVLTVKTSFNLSAATVQIVDMLGKVVLATRTATGNIDVSKLPAGIYYLVIIHDGEKTVKRFVKQ